MMSNIHSIIMKYLSAVSLAGAMVWLAGCASVSKVAVVEPVGPGPTVGSRGTGEGSLVIYSARASADVDINTAEWRWNNDYGKNEFLYEPAHSDYTIYARMVRSSNVCSIRATRMTTRRRR